MLQIKVLNNKEKYKEKEFFSKNLQNSFIFSKLKLHESSYEPMMTQIQERRTFIKKSYDLFSEDFYGALNYKFINKRKKDKKEHENFIRLKTLKLNEMKKSTSQKQKKKRKSISINTLEIFARLSKGNITKDVRKDKIKGLSVDQPQLNLHYNNTNNIKEAIY